jgi:esterase
MMSKPNVLAYSKGDANRPRSLRLDLGGWDAHALQWGEVGAPPVLLLHGFTANAHSWEHLARALSGTHDVVALDQRGHGYSAPTDRFGTKALVDDVGRTFDRLGWQSASIVGQSMGGVTGFLFAAREPSRVQRLVVIDSGPVAAPEGRARIQANVTGQDRFSSIEEVLLSARRSFPRADDLLLSHRVLHNLKLASSGQLEWRTARALMDGTAPRDDYSEDERWEAWRAIVAPTLLVHGQESDLLTLELVEQLISARPEIEVAHIERAGHAIPLDQPGALATVVERFLQDWSIAEEDDRIEV